MLKSFAAMLRSLPIRNKLTFIIIAICVSTLLLSTLIQMVFSFFNERNQIVSRLAATAEILAVQSTASLEFVDPVAARENLSSLRVHPSIRKACIYDQKGEVFAAYIEVGSLSSSTNNERCPALRNIDISFLWNSLSLFWDISSSNRKIGTLYVEYDLASMYQNILNVWLVNLLIIIAAIILAYFLSIYVQSLISKPILQLSERTRQFSLTHDYSIRVDKYSDDELGVLADDFNTMIEELKKHETELEKAITELTNSNTELERFAYICSHDLQEPLRMVSNYTELLRTRHIQYLNPEAREYMEFITQGAGHMRDLINDILAYSRIGHLKAETPRNINLEEIKNLVLNNLSLIIKESEAIITVEPLPTVYGYRSLFIQLFQNLISNALKFTKTKPCRIEIRARHSEHKWECAIQDNGIGIDPRYHEKVFDIFRRLNRREEYKGTGIGLAICKKVVETHGGRIWIKSQPEEGTTFYFTIPDNYLKLKKGLE